MAQLLDRYSGAYASIQFRALRQFFKWLAAEDQIPDPMTRLRAPRVAVRDVPVFTSGELSDLENACRGSTFAARRDAAIIAVFTATGIRLSELAGIRHKPGDPARSDPDLHAREIRIAGKAGKPRTVKIGHQAARSLDRYLRARHPQAWRSQLGLGVNSRGPLTATGIYQIIARHGRQAGEDGSVAPIIGGLPAVEGSAWDIGAPLDERGAGLAAELGSSLGQPSREDTRSRIAADGGQIQA
jgi:site-specific recombinase XerD